MTRRTVATAMLIVLSVPAVSGCTHDLDVYFTNNTDQPLTIVFIRANGEWRELDQAAPHKATTIGIFGSGCSDNRDGSGFVAADANHTIVKRFDEICWHGTYSIP